MEGKGDEEVRETARGAGLSRIREEMTPTNGMWGLAPISDLMPGRGRGDRLPGCRQVKSGCLLPNPDIPGAAGKNLVPYPGWVDHSGGCIFVYVQPGSRSCGLEEPAWGTGVPEAPPPGRSSVAGVRSTTTSLADQLIPGLGVANAFFRQLPCRCRRAPVLQTSRLQPERPTVPCVSARGGRQY